MRKSVLNIVVLTVGFVLIGGVFVLAGEETLVSKLVSDFGVTEKQASGGAGALLRHAQRSLGEADFGKVTSALPEISSLLESAPEGMGQGMVSGLGKGLQNLGGMAGVAKVFDNLGMKAEMVGKFIPTILSFVDAKGGASVMKILEGALK